MKGIYYVYQETIMTGLDFKKIPLMNITEKGSPSTKNRSWSVLVSEKFYKGQSSGTDFSFKFSLFSSKAFNENSENPTGSFI